MTEKPSYAHLEQEIAALRTEIAGNWRSAGINQALFEIADSVSSTTSLNELFPAIHRSLGAIIDATNFFIALYDEQRDTITFPYLVDTSDSRCGPVSGATAKDSLTARVLETRRPLLITDEEILQQRNASGHSIIKGRVPKSWLGVPLLSCEQRIGVMTVQSYDGSTTYDVTDVDTMNAVAAQVAVAILRKQIDARLQDSLGRFRNILENIAGIAIQGYDSQRRVTFWNSASEKLYGFTEHEAVGQRLEDLIIPPAMRPEVIRRVDSWANGGEAIPAGELLLQDKYGRAVPVFSSHVMYEGSGGREMFCMDVDLQPVKKAQASLETANANFLAAMDSLDAAVYVADMHSYELLFMNTKIREYSGANIGDCCWAALQTGQEGPCTFCTNSKLLAADGRPTPPYVWEFRNTKNQCWYQCRDQAIRWPDGRLVRLEIAVDISDRKAMEGLLRESSERFRTFFSAINDAVFVHPYRDSDFAPFIEVNDIACERYGYTREEFKKLSGDDINSKNPDLRREIDAHKKKLRAQGHLIFEAVHVKKSGTQFPVEINARIIEQGGEPVIMAVVRDITERKNAEAEKARLEDQLLQAQKLESIGRLAGGIAHDFNNMLGVILGRIELIMEETDTSLPWYKDLQEIHRAADRSANLTRQLLAFARKQTILPQVIDLSAKITDILSMLRRLIGENIELSWRADGDIWKVRIDPGQVDQILTNLCVNARDAIPGHGHISIELHNAFPANDQESPDVDRQTGDFVALSVTDNGCGMDEQVQANLFEPFFTTKAIGEGTGLGLATVYGIVKQNRGVIGVKSAPGQGSTFTVYLPRCTASEETPERIPEVAPVFTLDNKTVLLVEDEPAILNLTRTILQRLGCQVVAASTPEQALILARDHEGPLDILVTDIIMPGMDGLLLSEKILSLHPAIKRLFMSGYTDDIIADNGGLSRPLHFIQKPFTKKELVGKLMELLQTE